MGVPIKRSSGLRYTERLGVAALLVIIGFEPELAYADSHRRISKQDRPFKAKHLLNRCNEYDLLDILKEARRVYRATMRKIHPDKGGSIEKASEVTIAWKRIKELFARRGITL